MVQVTSGIAKAKEISKGRVKKAEEFQAGGRKVIGFSCAYVPLEMLTALDIIPYRLYADMAEPITEADRGLPTSFCPIMRSCLDCELKGMTSFLDGVVAIHSCDPQEKAARVREHFSKYPYFHFIDMPATLHPESLEYFREQLSVFQTSLQEFAGQKMSGPKLAMAIEEHNRQRLLVRNLYDLTKPNPPLITGTEILQVTKALMSLPVDEGNELVQQVIREVKERKNKPLPKATRLMIWTATLDDAFLMEILEQRANVVIDDNCAGIRPFRGLVKVGPDPLQDLANYYLKGITCARTFREANLGNPQKSFTSDVQSRFGFLKERAEAWRVDGVLLFLVRYCDPFAFEMMELKDYLDSIGLPSIYIEYDNTQGGLAPLKTRVEAFLETLQVKR